MCVLVFQMTSLSMMLRDVRKKMSQLAKCISQYDVRVSHDEWVSLAAQVAPSSFGT